MINPKVPRSAEIKFGETVDQRLKYWIVGSGVYLNLTGRDTYVDIQVLNSRGDITPGHIRIPVGKIPELIEDLTTLYNIIPK